MNYGLIFMARGDYATALGYFERATAFTPNYWALETNLATANAGMGRAAEAERHFQRGIALAPAMAEPRFFYARWLNSLGRNPEAAAHLELVLRINPFSFDSRDLLMRVYAGQGNRQALDSLVHETLRLAPADATALQFETSAAHPEPPEALLDLSLRQYQAGRFEDCIASAKRALEIKPGYAEAYNNIAAAYNSLGRWDEGIRAAQQAVRLKPDYQLAKNNLAWAVSRKQTTAAPK
jgi:tetratricopeptide (TPR) repeat protein